MGPGPGPKKSHGRTGGAIFLGPGPGPWAPGPPNNMKNILKYIENILKLYPVRCAHYPPPCLRGSLAHPVCQVSFAVAFPGFWDVKIMIFEDFGRSK